MKRLDNAREMDVLLQAGKVDKHHLFQLADQLATFHALTDEAEETPNIEKMQEDFADLAEIEAFIGQKIGNNAAKKIKTSIDFPNSF